MTEPSEREIRLRCIEAAARTPTPHGAGYPAGVLEAAEKWATWVLGKPAPLGLPKK